MYVGLYKRKRSKKEGQEEIFFEKFKKIDNDDHYIYDICQSYENNLEVVCTEEEVEEMEKQAPVNGDHQNRRPLRVELC